MSNFRDPIERRLSRWLLMWHDRLDGEGVIRDNRGRIAIRKIEPSCSAWPEWPNGYGQRHYTIPIAPFGK